LSQQVVLYLNMTFYEALGVHERASAEQIQDAYRTLVAKYHPDIDPSEEARQHTIEINQAFEVLSDPKKRESYDLRHITYYTSPGEEDPREVYRREFLIKQKEKKKLEAAIKEKVDKIIFHTCRIAAFGILLFSMALIADDQLPKKKYTEAAEFGSQGYFVHGKVNRNSVVPTKPELVSFMRTKTFVVPVPTDLHLNYNYNDTLNKLSIETMYFSKKPTRVSVTSNGQEYMWTLTTPYSFGAPYLLFVISTIVVCRRNFTTFSYHFAFVPLFVLIAQLILMTNEPNILNSY
jgi:curved DNA-binding protein CbpA